MRIYMYILHRVFQNFIDKLPEQLPVEGDVPRVACVCRHLFFFTHYLPSLSHLSQESRAVFRHFDVVEACQGILNISYNVNFILCIHSDTHNGA